MGKCKVHADVLDNGSDGGEIIYKTNVNGITVLKQVLGK
jgi:hypothetical protein